MQRLGLLALSALSALLVSASASALPLETGYTVDDPIVIVAGPVTATINPIDPLFINNGLNAWDTICLGGVCDIENQEWLVFDVTVSGGAVNDLGISSLFSAALGMGYFLDGGPPAPYTGDFTDPNNPNFDFTAGGGLTGTSLVLFVAYADGRFELDNSPFGPGAMQFMVAEFGGAGLGSEIGPATTPVEIVPEPGTALLFGSGLVLLGVRARRRR